MSSRAFDDPLYEVSEESIHALAALHSDLLTIVSPTARAKSKQAASLRAHRVLESSSPFALLEQEPPRPRAALANDCRFVRNVVNNLKGLLMVYTVAIIPSGSHTEIPDKLSCRAQQFVPWLDFAYVTHGVSPSWARSYPELPLLLSQLLWSIVVHEKQKIVPLIRQVPRFLTLILGVWLSHPMHYLRVASQGHRPDNGHINGQTVDLVHTQIHGELDLMDVLRAELRQMVGGRRTVRRLLRLVVWPLCLESTCESDSTWMDWIYYHLRASIAVLQALGYERAALPRRFFRIVLSNVDQMAHRVDEELPHWYLAAVVQILRMALCGNIDDSPSPHIVMNAIRAGIIHFLTTFAPVFERLGEAYLGDVAQIEETLAAHSCISSVLKVIHRRHAHLLEDNSASADARRSFPRLMYAFTRHWTEYTRFQVVKAWTQYITCCNRLADTHEMAFKVCPCKMSFYCSVACQRADWRARHRLDCPYEEYQGFSGKLAGRRRRALPHSPCAECHTTGGRFHRVGDGH
ncbi:hypothetical protein BD626DRAFT_520555 [Schizophyllum amplum]|uniref:MYND-type domain-containing protein n=1 Tax=Schizophyllum amplum TaxID=97359 RepID=A0A550BUG4_9AGAR|nr:hypothetical protein BD626DRAFT_520555 [Auriculariopsis ampla]